MWDWLSNNVLGPFLIVSLLGGGGLLFREGILKYLSSSIDARLSKEIEEIKSKLRTDEQEAAARLVSQGKELERIGNFMSSMQRDRNAALLNRKIEAAETVLRICALAAKLTVVVEILKTLKIPELLNAEVDTELFSSLAEGLKVDEILEEIKCADTALVELYLSEKSLSYYNVYVFVCSHAAITLKMLGSRILKKNVFKEGAIQREVLKVLPEYKNGFDELGETYGYYLVNDIRLQMVQALRADIDGDSSSAIQLEVSARTVQAEARRRIREAGIPDKLVNNDQDVSPIPTV
ncbi:MAG: hypothetical protein P1U50_07865 [Parvibaculaceae bacterium]|nr:hypothetical protein [Parvibaculaceae bacterium]